MELQIPRAQILVVITTQTLFSEGECSRASKL